MLLTAFTLLLIESLFPFLSFSSTTALHGKVNTLFQLFIGQNRLFYQINNQICPSKQISVYFYKNPSKIFHISFCTLDFVILWSKYLIFAQCEENILKYLKEEQIIKPFKITFKVGIIPKRQYKSKHTKI